MNPQRALKIIPREAVISAECRVNHYGGAWVIWARWEHECEDGTMLPCQRPVTQFVEPFSAAWWIAEYDRGLCDDSHIEKA